ncbi:MAG: metallophosphatase domain-containing protein [Leptospiraceae bacterium]|nr:metallophosphatase domain-containing protein [Leptospiraceae bacterium]
MKIFLISDTHMNHEKLLIPQCDLLIHSGDFSRKGTFSEMEIFLKWFSAQNSKHKILTAGNHDFFAERFPEKAKELAKSAGISFLLEEELVIEGLRIWASPISPMFRNMAFNRERGEKIKAHWDLIPEKLDILITHSPPKGIGDKTILGFHVGCSDLLNRVKTVEPRLHVFGHIHEAYGEYSDQRFPKTKFFNSASKKFFGNRVNIPLETSL